MSSDSDIYLPGQPVPLPSGPQPQLGQGLYSKNGEVRASLVGTPQREGAVSIAILLRSMQINKGHLRQTLSITRRKPKAPSLNSVVLGQITRLSPTQAYLAISVVDGIPLPYGEEFQGMIRAQDVRATEKDKVKIAECFRGGDVVKGIVVRCSQLSHMFLSLTTIRQISLGDARSYYVSTARNDLGVIFATSEAGASMEPVSWQEMRCTKTGRLEKRKCAKPEGL